MRNHLVLMLSSVIALSAAGCGKTNASYDPKAIEAEYGVSGAYVDQISTQEGDVDATIVPTTLADGRRVQLVIPHKQIDPQHRVFMRDGVTITPVELADASQPKIVERRVVESRPAPSSSTVTARKKRSTKDELLIVGGSAGAGTAIGAIAGGKKGAAIGGVSGGVAGLVYDLATRNKQ